MAIWLNVVLSLFGGVLGAFALDLWLKPRLARRRAAVLLRAEIRNNRDHLHYRRPKTEGIGIHMEFVLPTWALDGTIGVLGEFPVQLGEALVSLYHSYARVLRAYETQVQAFNEALGKDDNEGRLQKNFEVTRETLRQMIEATIAESNEVLGMLEKEVAKSVLPGRRPRRLPPPPAG
jgi:hypothetical protein